jgi:hypothetical protein
MFKKHYTKFKLFVYNCNLEYAVHPSEQNERNRRYMEMVNNTKEEGRRQYFWKTASFSEKEETWNDLARYKFKLKLSLEIC